MAYLPVQVTMSVANILDTVDPAAADSYERLKAALCQGFTRSRSELAFELQSLPGLGDRTPTELMRHLTTLGPDGDVTGTWFMAPTGNQFRPRPYLIYPDNVVVDYNTISPYISNIN